MRLVMVMMLVFFACGQLCWMIRGSLAPKTTEERGKREKDVRRGAYVKMYVFRHLPRVVVNTAIAG